MAGPQVHIAVLAYDGVDELDLFGVYAVLSKAAQASVGTARALTISLVADRSRVRTAAGIALEVNSSIHSGLITLADAEAIVIPGGRGALDAAADPALLAAIRAADARGAALYAVCSGAFVLAAAGLGAHRTLAVHHSKREQLHRLGATDVGIGLIRDGNLCTVGGDRRPSVKAVDLAFALLAEVLPEVVDVVSTRMEISPGRPGPGS